MSEYYDRSGRPITSVEWSISFSDFSKKRVAFDKLDNGEVSTVWLGLNHQYGDGPPLIFETMVFGGPLDQKCERYSTEEQAVAGHTAMVERVKHPELEGHP